METTSTDIAGAARILTAAAADGDTARRQVQDAVTELGGLLGLTVLRPAETRSEWAVVLLGEEVTDPVPEATARGWMRYPRHTALLRRPIYLGPWEVLQEQGDGVGSALAEVEGRA